MDSAVVTDMYSCGIEYAIGHYSPFTLVCADAVLSWYYLCRSNSWYINRVKGMLEITEYIYATYRVTGHYAYRVKVPMVINVSFLPVSLPE